MIKNRRLIKIVFCACVILGFILWFAYGKHRYDTFYDNPIKSVVIERDNSALRSTVFTLSNSIEIDSFGVKGYQYDLKVGDSVVKAPYSDLFFTYRKNSQGKYIIKHRYRNKK